VTAAMPAAEPAPDPDPGASPPHGALAGAARIDKVAWHRPVGHPSPRFA